MGSSIWLVVLVPLMAVYALFGGIKGAIFGYPQAEVVLPYNEESGTVWEYDAANDPYIGLDEVKVDGDEQIFVFSARENDDENTDTFANDEAYVSEESLYSDDEISAIAENCGFADRYAFSKAFKKYTGVSPAKYRMQNKS